MKKIPPDPDLDALLASCEAPEDEGDLSPTGHSVNRDIFTQSKNGINGFAVIPLWVVKEMTDARAHHAVALAIVLLQRMRARKTDTLPLTATIWGTIGAPSERERQTILQHLRRVPGVLRLEERHKRLTRYQVTLGDMWNED
jgi:hypothetical protein